MQEILWWCTELRITDVARVTAVAQIQSLAQKILHALGAAKNKPTLNIGK